MRTVVLMSVLGVTVFCYPSTGAAAPDAGSGSLSAALGLCDWECDYCWCGTEYEQDCPIEWFYDGDCDCGCQFCDMACDCNIQDCGSGPAVGACCAPDQLQPVCYGAYERQACRDAGGAYMGDGVSCSAVDYCVDRCAPGCAWCWSGTVYDNNCPMDWYGAGDGCDCGCQWQDPDCSGPAQGACCCPDITCYDAISQAECVSADCVYQGDGSICAQGCPCDGMTLPCEWCWVDTPYENNCDPAWNGDGECDCGCQWQDQDCGESVVGACCGPLQPLSECVEDAAQQVCLDAGGAYMGDGASCAAVDCGTRCAQECLWCWAGTLAENNCDPAWNGDGECDCHCQFCDSDCPSCVADVSLVSGAPACDSSLTRAHDNCVRFTFDGGITAANPGDIKIQRLLSGGGYDPTNLSNQFTFTVEGGNVLKIAENGDALSNGTWYAIRNTGDWSGVAPFKVDYRVIYGDVDNNGSTTAADASDVWGSRGPAAGDCDPYDVDGNGSITASDASDAWGSRGSTAGPKPSGHVCSP